MALHCHCWRLWILAVVMMAGLLVPPIGAIVSIAPAAHGHSISQVRGHVDDGHSHADRDGTQAPDSLANLLETILGHHGMTVPVTAELIGPAALRATYGLAERPGLAGRNPTKDRDPPRLLTPS